MRRKTGSKQYSDLLLRNIRSDLATLRLIWKVWTILSTPNQALLLKEQALYCFLLRCKKPKDELLMEWVVETVLP